VPLLIFPKAHNLFHGTSGAKSGDFPCSCAFLLNCWFIFAGMCMFVFIYATANSWDGLGKRFNIYFFNVAVQYWKRSGNIAATLYVRYKRCWGFALFWGDGSGCTLQWKTESGSAINSTFNRLKMEPWRAVNAHSGVVEGLCVSGRRFACLWWVTGSGSKLKWKQKSIQIHI